MRILAVLLCFGLVLTGCQDSDPPPPESDPAPPAPPPPAPAAPAADVGLDIGNLAPEIEGEDLKGAAFKLSDYRGKVVVLDFWGDW